MALAISAVADSASLRPVRDLRAETLPCEVAAVQAKAPAGTTIVKAAVVEAKRHAASALPGRWPCRVLRATP